MRCAWVGGSFDDVRVRHVRLLEEASHYGPVHVLLWSDAMVQASTGAAPRFPAAERLYILQALRYVQQVRLVDQNRHGTILPEEVDPQDVCVVLEEELSGTMQAMCRARGLQRCIIGRGLLESLPPVAPQPSVKASSRKKVVVTGCFDWFHSGHVRFFEEVSQMGDLYVIVGHDRNVRELKGRGHPMFHERQRWYMVQAVRFVTQACISTGHGWMDAQPEILQIRPDIYAVNDDGDHPDKRRFCHEHGMEYIVLRRLPKPGLPPRQSTQLRGF